MEKRADRLSELFSRLVAYNHQDEKSACADSPLCSLNSNDLKVLCLLSCKNQPAINEISDELAIPMSTLTGIFNKLVSKKLVTRDRCSNDRRVVRVQLTENGRKAAEVKQQHSHNFAIRILSSLNEDEQQQLIGLLEKIALN